MTAPETVGQAGPQHVPMRHRRRANDHVFIVDHRLQRLVQLLQLDPPRSKVPAVLIPREIAAASQESHAALNRFFKRKIFQAMKRIMVHERSHRPVLGDDFARQADDAQEFHPLVRCH